MSQDTFNKLVTTFLMLFFACVYVYSLITGHTIDWQQLLGFIVPTINHIVHQISGTQVQTTVAKTQADITVASINKNGTTPVSTSGGAIRA